MFKETRITFPSNKKRSVSQTIALENRGKVVESFVYIFRGFKVI